MRKIIVTGLLAATLVPGFAQAQAPQDIRQDRRDVRQERHDIRQDRHDEHVARQEYRDDWRDYRRAHPDAYRGPRWVGPRGYDYRPVQAGFRFRPDLYDRRYWVDPVRYHLRPAFGPQRWVRYGNDVVLVDTRSGRVIEVNNGFFY